MRTMPGRMKMNSESMSDIGGAGTASSAAPSTTRLTSLEHHHQVASPANCLPTENNNSLHQENRRRRATQHRYRKRPSSFDVSLIIKNKNKPYNTTTSSLVTTSTPSTLMRQPAPSWQSTSTSGSSTDSSDDSEIGKSDFSLKNTLINWLIRGKRKGQRQNCALLVSHWFIKNWESVNDWPCIIKEITQWIINHSIDLIFFPEFMYASRTAAAVGPSNERLEEKSTNEMSHDTLLNNEESKNCTDPRSIDHEGNPLEEFVLSAAEEAAFRMTVGRGHFSRSKKDRFLNNLRLEKRLNGLNKEFFELACRAHTRSLRRRHSGDLRRIVWAKKPSKMNKQKNQTSFCKKKKNNQKSYIFFLT